MTYKFFTLISILIIINGYSQQKEYDTLVIKNMIVGSVKEDIFVGTKINEKCLLENTQGFKSIHNSIERITLITDYILCNNGKPNMFFEIYDGESFKYVKDTDISFSENNGDNLKVTLSNRTSQEKDFVRSHINVMVDFIKDYGNEKDEEEISDAMSEAIQPFIEAEKYGLGIIKYNAVEGYSSTGAAFKIFNAAKKTKIYMVYSCWRKSCWRFS